MACELQRDWNRQATAEGFAEIALGLSRPAGPPAFRLSPPAFCRFDSETQNGSKAVRLAPLLVGR